MCLCTRIGKDDTYVSIPFNLRRHICQLTSKRVKLSVKLPEKINWPFDTVTMEY